MTDTNWHYPSVGDATLLIMKKVDTGGKRTSYYIGFFVLSAFFFAGAHSALAATVNYYVDPTGTNSGAGTSAGSNAWQTIQYAVTNVANPTTDTIIINIAAGTYNTSNTTISVDRNFLNLSLRGDSATSTLIQPAATPSSSTVRVFDVGGSENVAFEKMTIRYGRITTTFTGSAIHTASGGSLTIRDAVIDDNDGTGSFVSGGIYSNSSTTIERTTFSNNNGSYVNAYFGNSTTNTFTNTTFYNNAGGSVGGLYINASSNTTFTNSLFASSSQFYLQGSQTVRVKNSVILGTPNGNAIYYYNFSGTVTDNGNNIIGGEAGVGGTVGPYFVNGVNGTVKLATSATVLTVGIANSLADNSSTNGVPTLAIQAGSQTINGGLGGSNGSIAVPIRDARVLFRTSVPDIGPYEYEGTESAPVFSTPTVAATNISIGNTSQASSTISWTNGNGSYRTVFMKADVTTGEPVPVDGTLYSANTVFGSGAQIGATGWYAVYSGTGASVTVSNIDNTRSYRVHVVEYNGPYDATSLYFTTAGSGNPATKSVYVGVTVYSNYTSGNDSSGNGTSVTPYKSFTKAYTSAFDGDTIDLTGTFNWLNADETGDASATGYSIVKANLTIRGQGATTTIVQAASSVNVATRRVFTQSVASTTIQNMTIRYGVTASGGCLAVTTAGTLTLSGIIMDQCVGSTHAGGISVDSVANVNVTVNNSSFTGNTAQFSAGGIYFASSGGTLQATNVTFTGNVSNVHASSGSSNGGSAINTITGTARLTNVTITRNSSPFGALKIGGGTTILKNTIIAGNTGVTADNVNIYRSAGTMTSNGYNILGAHSTAYFNATTTGDWTDRTGSGTYALYPSSGTTGTFTLGATTTAANGTTYAPLSAGSIGIEHGSTTANGTVSIPTTDQLGVARTVVPDIGAYEYFSSDSSAPTVSLTLPTDGITIYGSAIGMTATASDDVAIAGVRFFVNGIGVGVEDTVAPYAIFWNSLIATTSGAKIIHAVARDTSNNYATSSASTVTLSNQPLPTSLAYTSSTTTAVFTWTTPVEGSSRMFFGFTNALASSTAEQSTSTRLLNHSIDLSGLPKCTVYKYQTVSKNESSEVATSTESTFVTAGCSGSAAITANSQGDITAVGGGSLTEGALRLTVPASFTSTSSQATFQAKKLNGSTFFANITSPSGKTRAGNNVYNLTAYTDTSTTLSTFSAPLTVTLTYEASDIVGLDSSTLKIQRYDSSAWSPLASCSVDTSAKTVTCTTTAFSDFAIFGDPAATVTATSRAKGGQSIQTQVRFLTDSARFVEAVKLMRQWRNLFTSAQIKAVDALVIKNAGAKPLSSSPSRQLFTRNLEVGSLGTDVRELQQFLNTHGYPVAVTGPGSVNSETNKFGAGTRTALIKFQVANSITPATGYFGQATRAFVTSMSGVTQTEAPASTPTAPKETKVISAVRDLTAGMQGADVTALQTLLIAQGFPLASGLTGYFGAQTRAALSGYQTKVGIIPSTGRFGDKTRAQMKTAGLAGLWW